MACPRRVPSAASVTVSTRTHSMVHSGPGRWPETEAPAEVKQSEDVSSRNRDQQGYFSRNKYVSLRWGEKQLPEEQGQN